jgi:type VI secretion system protein ImpA
MINYEQIISPFHDQNPCGLDLREEAELSSKYLNLKSVRSSLRKEERTAFEASETKTLIINKDGWIQVTFMADEILSNDSKDIEVAVWMLEGLVRIQGIVGLKIGFDILSSLLKNYELLSLNPRIIDIQDVDQVEDFLLPITMLNGRYETGTIIAPIYFCPLISTLDGHSYNGWELKNILEEQKLIKNNNNIISKEALLESDTIRTIVASLNKEEFIKEKDNLDQTMKSFKEFNLLLSEKFHSNAPSLNNIDKVLGYCYSLVKGIYQIAFEDTKTANLINDDVALLEKKQESTDLDLDLNSIDYAGINKAKALQLIEILIRFFENSEPHSPVSYLLSRVLRWSQLTLPEILPDLIPNQEERLNFCKFSGVPFINEQSDVSMDK